mmetsp:Transcript_29849/g.69296  ORF Transcript_29849/g.69296 Transcript_29849/m.69296 type:complete len:202 (+) Transcript_29849:121-726(+)
MTLTSQQETNIWVVSTAMGILSILAGLSIIYSYFRFETLRKFSFELVVFLAISDIGSNMTYFLGHRAELVGEGLCTLQGMTQQFFELASVLWTVVIGLTLWSSVVRQVKMENRAAMHGFAWGTSFIIMLLPLSTDSYGPAGSWCWIKDKMPGTVWRYIVFYVPLWLAFAWVCYLPPPLHYATPLPPTIAQPSHPTPPNPTY